jgi:glyoxylase-like metal-dependent hydrolase (beta-lactamase superfamily II)
MEPFYRAEKVTDRITAIHSGTHEILYLVEGEKRAVLLDTSVGAGCLRDFVAELTRKPVTVLLTHGHIDHAMGAPEFDEVYLNPLDRPVYDSMSDFEMRKGYIFGNLGGCLPDGLEETFVPPYPVNFRDLHDGDRFDLGGVHITMYGCPGHTKGCMTALLEEERILVMGDAGNNATFLFDENSLTVEEYWESLLRLRQCTAEKFDRIFVMHHVMELPSSLLDQLIAVCEDIMAGNTWDKEFRFHGATNYIAKEANRQFERVDGRNANIIYNKKKIFRSE